MKSLKTSETWAIGIEIEAEVEKKKDTENVTDKGKDQEVQGIVNIQIKNMTGTKKRILPILNSLGSLKLSKSENSNKNPNNKQKFYVSRIFLRIMSVN